MIDERAEQVKQELLHLGADRYDLWLPETHQIAAFLKDNEHILGIVYGHYNQDQGQMTGRGALLATNLRILLLDKKPFFERRNEIVYGSINAVSFSKAGYAATVIIHTRIGDISVRTLNHACARTFVQAVEEALFMHQKQNTFLGKSM